MFKKLVIILVIAVGTLGYGQTMLNDNQTLKFKQYSLTEGLSQSSVLCILQDRQGFMWFGTRDGLNKFDGQNFITYRHNSQDSTSISNSYIRSLREDDQGNIWVGTMNGLNKYITKNDSFERFNKDHTQNSISNNEIWDIEIGDDGNLWLGTNQGLERFDPSTYKATSIKTSDGDSENSKTHVRSLMICNEGNVWICTTNSIEFYNPDSQVFKEYSYPEGESKIDNKNYAPVIYQDRQHRIWLGYKNGLFLFDVSSEVFNPYIFDSDNYKSITDEVRVIHQDRSNNLWIGTYNGVFVAYQNPNRIYHYTHDENDRTSLSQNSIYAIYEDIKGDIWLGTYAGGINYYDRSFDVFKNFTAGTNDYKLNYKVVSSIVEEPKSNILIGTEGGGINVYHHKTGKFTYHVHNPSAPNSLSTDNVKAMIRTKDGKYWIGTHDGGLNVFDLSKQPTNFTQYVNIPNDSTSLSNNRIISLYEDAREDVWIGTSGGGLNKWQHDSGRIVRIPDADNVIGSIVYAITPTNNKNSLLISSSNGLAEINVLTHQWTPISYKNSDNNVGHIHATLYAYEDPDQNLWIATEGDGLYYYNTTTGQSIKYGMSDGLPNEVIYGILPDDFNTIWLSTNNGLSRFDPASKTFDNFDVSDGLVGNEFNYGAFKKLSNGDLMFGGATGVTYFNPDDIIKNAFVPPVVLTSFLVNNQPFVIDDEEHEPIKLKYDQNAVSFNFVALSYSKPVKTIMPTSLKALMRIGSRLAIKKQRPTPISIREIIRLRLRQPTMMASGMNKAPLWTSSLNLHHG